jgi:hypothetical protein
MKYILIPIILSFVNRCYAQYEIKPELSNHTVLIEVKGFGSGSGIYIQDSAYIYLVTAAHVITDLKSGSVPCDSTFLITYRANTETDKADTLFLSLCDAFKNGYALADLKNDIAIIKLANAKQMDSTWLSIAYLPHATRKGIGTKIYSWNYKKHVKKLNDIKLGNDVFLFGYPKSLNLQFTFDYNRPLLRKGNIAGRDMNMKRIIIDCPSFQGNSGGPVYSLYFEQSNLFLIGIVSAFIPFEEYWYNDKYPVRNVQISNSGYSVIIPIEFAINLIPKLK